MIRPDVQCRVTHCNRQSPSPSNRNTNSIIIYVETISDQVRVSPTILICIRLCSSNPLYIRNLLRCKLISRGWLAPDISTASTKLGFSQTELLQDSLVSHIWLSDYLAPQISAAATELGFGRNGFTMTINVKITGSPSKEKVLSRTVQLGKMNREELKCSEMETEPCSICLDDLVSGGSNSKHGVPTRMTCSHVFHDGCLLEWLQRKNTCPLCRTVLYDL